MNVISIAPARYRPLILPLISLSAIILLTFTLGRFIFGRIIEVRKDTEELGTKNRMLESKLTTLSGLEAGKLEQEIKTAVLAVPADNPSIFALSTIRSIAQESGLAISNFRVGEKQEGEGSDRNIEMGFSLQGSGFSVFSFVKTLQNAAPLMRVTGFDVSVSGSEFSANISLLSSWRSLPKELGKTESPLEAISQAEQELLQKLSQLRKSLIGEVSASAPAGKEDPFAF